MFTACLYVTAAGLTCTLLQEALEEIRHVLQNQAESLHAKFKDMDTDGNGCIDVHEWTAALQQLGVDMPKPRAERLFKARLRQHTHTHTHTHLHTHTHRYAEAAGGADDCCT